MTAYPPAIFANGDTVYVKHADWFRVPRGPATIELTSWSVDFGQWSHLLTWTDGRRCYFCQSDLTVTDPN